MSANYWKLGINLVVSRDMLPIGARNSRPLDLAALRLLILGP